MMLRRLSSVLILTLIMNGCAVVDEVHNYLKEEYKAASGRDSHEVALAKLVAATRTSQTTRTNLVTMHGTYGGLTRDGCHRVTIRAAELKHTGQYRVCNDRVYGLYEPVPRAPAGREIDPVRDSVARSAWSTGKPASAPAGDYRVEAVPQGPADAQGCRFIEERVTYGDHVVDVQRRKICS